MITEAKSQPNKVTYGSGGPGTTLHFASEALGIASGANLMHVPFKGAAEATQAILSGTIDMQIASTTGLMSNVKGGKLRPPSAAWSFSPRCPRTIAAPACAVRGLT